ncbi:MAG: SGNH/GDSL hydrolase family protein [Gemmataceae bacterium]
MLRWLSFLCVSMLFVSPASADEFRLKPGKVLFLGDSNTYAGQFVAYVDAYLAGRFPDQKYELINIGLPSETVTGLTEDGHPFPRPDVHERAERALEKIKPNYVVVCYGMNDGIYHPFSEDRFAKYKECTLNLVAKIRKAGAQPILMTPCPFDPVPLKGRTLPKGSPKFDFGKPYEGYDDVLSKYSAWLVSLRTKNLPVADPHTAILSFLAEVRKSDPKYVISHDGIHPNSTGHALVAFTLLKELNAPASFANVEGKANKTLAHIPMPAPKDWHPALAPHYAELNHMTFKQELPNDAKVILQGVVLPRISKNAAALLPNAEPSLAEKANAILKLTAERESIVRHAWLTEVGHKRPGIAAGQPLEKLRPRLADLQARIEEIAKPVAVEVEVRDTK